MTLTLNKNIVFARFVSCVRGARLLKILPEAARRAMAGESIFNFIRRFRISRRFQASMTEQK